MGAAKIKAAHRAALEKGMAEVSAIDKRWFEANPDRSTYIRHVLPVEIAFVRESSERIVALEPGNVELAIVRSIRGIGPGYGRIRQLVIARSADMVQADEAEATALWRLVDSWSGGRLKRCEEEVRNELSAGGRTVH